MFPSVDPRLAASLYANLCSLALDYTARQKVGGLHLTYGYLKQLPVLPPSKYSETCPWHSARPASDWILPRVLELTYSVWDLKPFAEDCGDDGPPFLWDLDRRFQLQCEIDAAFFHLYGVARDDVDYMLGTFDVLQRAQDREHGEFRIRRRVLDTFDALAEAATAGRPYVSPLGPPRRVR